MMYWFKLRNQYMQKDQLGGSMDAWRRSSRYNALMKMIALQSGSNGNCIYVEANGMVAGKIACRERLGGMLKYYHRAA